MAENMYQKSEFSTEKEVQDWLESAIANNTLISAIRGAKEVEAALRKSEASDFWPSFPIDYLSRLANLRAATSVLASFHSLELICKNTTNLSVAKGERLFADLLYCSNETSTFVVIEVKNQNGSVREAVTELLAYEHEILNQVPFSGSNDIKMVVVSRDFSTLLDHAITGLNTWTRRKVLCLRFDDTSDKPILHVHIPRAWSAIGQMTLPADGLVTAALSFRPSPELTEQETRAVCETAAALMVREAERAGGSGFAIVAYNHFYPGLADGPFLILAGVVNPFSFAQWAVDAGFLKNTSSPLAQYVLEGGVLGDLSMSWNWVSCDSGAAREYLSAYGSPSWGDFSDWRTIRHRDRWTSIRMDRHITPISVDFWGVLGDYARDAVRRVERMRKFKLGLAKPGLDWRHPLLGVLLLDEVAIEPVVDAGQWTFSALFETGLRLGRFVAFASQYADADEHTERLLRAPLFWAEADAFGVLQELALRYGSSTEITTPPPIVKIGWYESAGVVEASVTALAEWVHRDFIGANQKLMHDAFYKGNVLYAVFDPQFGDATDNPQIASLFSTAVETARDWLKCSVVAATGGLRDSEAARVAIDDVFGALIPLRAGKEKALAAVDALSEKRLVDALFKDIPRIVDTWLPQLAHNLIAPSLKDCDWDWIEEQIRQARARGEKQPCIAIGADGRVGIASVSTKITVPEIKNVDQEVLLVINESSAEMFFVVTWADLRSGNIPWLSTA